MGLPVRGSFLGVLIKTVVSGGNRPAFPSDPRLEIFALESHDKAPLPLPLLSKMLQRNDDDIVSLHRETLWLFSD